MPIRYEIPSEDREEQARWAAERRAEWESLAMEVTTHDPAFQRWKRIHWGVTWAAAVSAFAALLWVAIDFYNPQRPQHKHFAPPFVVASAILGAGAWLYDRRVRKIGIEVWSRKREEEFRKKQPNHTSEPASPSRGGSS